MKVVLCTSGGYPGAAVLQILRASTRIEVAGIVLSTRILSARYGFLRGAWEQFKRSGARYTAYLGITSLAPLRSHGIPVHRTRDVNHRLGRQFIEKSGGEIVVTAFFNQWLGDWCRGVNIHPSLLPALRGVDPVFFARLRGAPLGVSLHRLAPELDAGELIAQRHMPTLADESILAATTRLYAHGAQLFLDSLEAVQTGKVAPQSGAMSYDSWPTREQVAALRAKAIRLVRPRDLLGRAR